MPDDARDHAARRLVTRVTLPDGGEVDVRALEPDDGTLLEELLAHLSPQSRYHRFLTHVERFSRIQLEALTALDHERQEALVALDRASGEPVAVARYAALAEDPSVAEVAVTVQDAWQGRGLGSALLERLAAHARAHGISRLGALILGENVPMLKLMAALGPVVARSQQGAAVELVVALRDAAGDEPAPARRA